MILSFVGAFFGIIFIGLGMLGLKWLKVKKGIKFYKDQGAAVVPGASRFLIGNQLELMKMTKKRARAKEPQKRIYSLLIDSVPGLDTEENASVNHKLIVYCPIGRVKLFVSDPQMVQDLLQTKNKVFDKDGETAINMKDLMGNSFLFSKGDAVWKQKR